MKQALGAGLILLTLLTGTGVVETVWAQDLGGQIGQPQETYRERIQRLVAERQARIRQAIAERRARIQQAAAEQRAKIQQAIAERQARIAQRQAQIQQAVADRRAKIQQAVAQRRAKIQEAIRQRQARIDERRQERAQQRAAREAERQQKRDERNRKPPPENHPAACNNNKDDDEDTKVDFDDPDCKGLPECWNGKDDDGDGQTDQQDKGCKLGNHPNGRYVPQDKREDVQWECANDKDDDNPLDGLIDEQDPSCFMDWDVRNVDSFRPRAKETRKDPACVDRIENDRGEFKKILEAIDPAIEQLVHIQQGRAANQDPDQIDWACWRKLKGAWRYMPRLDNDEKTDRQCMDHMDNDNDGKFDREDPQCHRREQIEEKNPLITYLPFSNREKGEEEPAPVAGACYFLDRDKVRGCELAETREVCVRKFPHFREDIELAENRERPYSYFLAGEECRHPELFYAEEHGLSCVARPNQEFDSCRSNQATLFPDAYADCFARVQTNVAKECADRGLGWKEIATLIPVGTTYVGSSEGWKEPLVHTACNGVFQCAGPLPEAEVAQASPTPTPSTSTDERPSSIGPDDETFFPERESLLTQEDTVVPTITLPTVTLPTSSQISNVFLTPPTHVVCTKQRRQWFGIFGDPICTQFTETVQLNGNILQLTPVTQLEFTSSQTSLPTETTFSPIGTAPGVTCDNKYLWFGPRVCYFSQVSQSVPSFSLPSSSQTFPSFETFPQFEPVDVPDSGLPVTPTATSPFEFPSPVALPTTPIPSLVIGFPTPTPSPTPSVNPTATVTSVPGPSPVFTSTTAPQPSVTATTRPIGTLSSLQLSISVSRADLQEQLTENNQQVVACEWKRTLLSKLFGWLGYDKRVCVVRSTGV